MTFMPCASRMRDFEEGITYGCLRDVNDGHCEEAGPTHVNNGRAWSALRSIGADRCESMVTSQYGIHGEVWRCVEDAGHYPQSIHTKEGRPRHGWTDAMSLNPPQIMDEVVESDPVNRALGVTGFYQPGADGYTAEQRRVRENALHHARKSFKQHTEDPWTHARDVVAVAQVFERYLTGNTKDEETES